MSQSHWDKIAPCYDSEIFDVLANDSNGILLSYISRFASKKSVAGDFGCGVGKFLPTLSKQFRLVHAMDISQACLKVAQARCRCLPNIEYLRVDLSDDSARLAKVDFALSVNVAIMACRRTLAGILKKISKSLRHGGHFVLVVPSLESMLFAEFRLIQWNLKSGMTHAQATSASVEEAEGSLDLRLEEGLVDIDGVATKHYLKEELIVLLEDLRFDIEAIEKVEYDWSTEFDQPPRWMKEPYPWDWLVLSKKRK
ncbi:MAG: class I SAM-dependent methyltransferase [Planctomycetota bacterium]|nr:MAG: class I SAM-dependent methyltransferase [Planctomycetota bacterium]